MAAPVPDPASLVSELKEVRRAGPVRLRGRALPALESAADAVVPSTAGTTGAAVESLLRLAVSQLDAGTLRTAAEYTLGLAPGTRDRPASERRARAAEVYRVSVERFRKDHEVVVLEQVAEHILRLAAAPAAAPAPTAGPGGGTHRTVRCPAGGRQVELTLHVHPVDLLREVDVVVSPSNLHFALPEPYKSSVAASLRRASARHGVTGDVLADPVQDELRAWAAEHGVAGRAVRPGTVAATGSGALVEQGVRRIYHAAVAVPRAGTNDYDVLPTDVTRAAARALAVLAEEHRRFDPPLRSICFPLLGSGRGGLPHEVSLAAVWAAVEAELARGAQWEVHFVVRTPEAAALVERIPAGLGPAHDRRPAG
ncbi:macro domain-containing protein [Kitasatospora griseola]|uniref:hypothetical protein n=1 Tax=Kitasatospora griseola TaxID=2064 RepID=UPI00364DFDE7